MKHITILAALLCFCTVAAQDHAPVDTVVGQWHMSKAYRGFFGTNTESDSTCMAAQTFEIHAPNNIGALVHVTGIKHTLQSVFQIGGQQMKLSIYNTDGLDEVLEYRSLAEGGPLYEEWVTIPSLEKYFPDEDLGSYDAAERNNKWYELINGDSTAAISFDSASTEVPLDLYLPEGRYVAFFDLDTTFFFEAGVGRRGMWAFLNFNGWPLPPEECMGDLYPAGNVYEYSPSYPGETGDGWIGFLYSQDFAFEVSYEFDRATPSTVGLEEYADDTQPFRIVNGVLIAERTLDLRVYDALGREFPRNETLPFFQTVIVRLVGTDKFWKVIVS